MESVTFIVLILSTVSVGVAAIIGLYHAVTKEWGLFGKVMAILFYSCLAVIVIYAVIIPASKQLTMLIIGGGS